MHFSQALTSEDIEETSLLIILLIAMSLHALDFVQLLMKQLPDPYILSRDSWED